MADVTITGLPNAATLTGPERVPMDQGGATVDAPASAIAALATKTTVGLGNCDNTSDLAKPISTATQAALNLKPSTAEAAAAAPVQSVSFSVPSGWVASSNNTGGNVVLTLALPVGFSLPSNTSQANWDTAFSERLRWDGGAGGLVAATGRASLGLGTASTHSVAATGDAASGEVVKGNDTRLTDARTPAAHNQAANTISDSTATGRAVLTAADAPAARTAIGAGTSSLAISSAAPAALAATAAAGSTGQAADAGHAHQRDTDVLVVDLSGSASDPTAANTIETFGFTFAAEILASELRSETVASGSAFQVNARLNASSIYSVRPQIAIGSTVGSPGTLAITAAAIGDVLRFDISQAGGGCRLAKLYLTIRRTA